MSLIDNWLTPRTGLESLELLSELALTHTAQGGSQGLTLSILVREKKWREVLDFDIQMDAFANSEEAYHCRQAKALFSKLEWLDLGQDKEAAALQKFEMAEERCKLTNDVFRLVESGEFSLLPDVSAVLHRAMRKISLVLGECPVFEDLPFRFGPGATLNIKKKDASLIAKLGSSLQCTQEFRPYLQRMLPQMPAFADLHCDAGGKLVVDFVDDKLSFVTKTADIDRGITVGAGCNLLAQLAIGDYMKDRLSRFGIDIRDQSKNQRLALQGSKDGKIATIDLVSASDMQANLLIRHLFPVDWYILMDGCRSHRLEYNGRTITLEKFTGMGNGFTFPVETLVFWALSSSLSDDDNFCSVYGDDIIVDADRFTECIRILEVCGFEPNRKKSFNTGPFRESCGVDGYQGHDIRPVYMYNYMSICEMYRLHNFYWRRGYLRQRLIVLSWCPDMGNLYGPDGFGDGHLIGEHPRIQKKAHALNGYAGYLFKTFRLRKLLDPRYGKREQYALALYTTYRASYEVVDIDLQRCFLNMSPYMNRYRHRRLTIAGEPLPTVISPVDGLDCKVVPLPGSDESYEVVSIYTF